MVMAWSSLMRELLVRFWSLNTIFCLMVGCQNLAKVWVWPRSRRSRRGSSRSTIPAGEGGSIGWWN